MGSLDHKEAIFSEGKENTASQSRDPRLKSDEPAHFNKCSDLCVEANELFNLRLKPISSEDPNLSLSGKKTVINRD